ncbi:hypothetical protein CPB84DRAFT_1223311 [Gymnopilus junonius]|uniref:Uncharacterized protein n=1 Tax=Gymnopilus junonius TaxID=109634 RepID=A0A9P5TT32_GYMJU|nr:hypothetical protein CPB84DRAFT_1223311 [Gymnopilus junonius]
MSSSLSISSISMPVATPIPTTSSVSTLPTTSTISFPSISPGATSRIAYLSSTTTSLVACLTIMITLMYLVLLSWTVRYAKENPKVVNKVSGVWVVRWLVLQWQFNHNYPNTHTRAGTRLLLFASSWTTLTGRRIHPSFYSPSVVEASYILNWRSGHLDFFDMAFMGRRRWRGECFHFRGFWIEGGVGRWYIVRRSEVCSVLRSLKAWCSQQG